LDKPNASGWKSVLLEHAITPIQQYSYTVGKNSQIPMIIDAMDLLYSDKVDGFVVSSDSDFLQDLLSDERIRNESHRNWRQKTPIH
jgi:hypothetical protein